MMRRSLMLIVVAAMVFAAGCGIIEEATQTVNFAAETTTYLQSITNFGQNMQTMAEQALTDLNARTDLKEQLLALKQQIKEYGALTVPDYAKDLHQSITEYNAQLNLSIDKALTNIEQGRAAFEATGIPDTINKINELLNQLNQLTPQ
ncbi:DUF6376 family protein [Paenibacillus sp. YIM B09110]|uniref:DUF6376 family protein n=1 Tax=Paenibacillus sp. YIM B09110 TaxID=3126102 RepID=UPI00301C1812